MNYLLILIFEIKNVLVRHINRYCELLRANETYKHHRNYRFCFWLTPYLLIISVLSLVFIDARAQCGIFPNLRYGFNRQDSTFNAYALHCDPCIYGSEGATICQCRYNCENARDSCAKDCIKKFTGLIQLAQCIEACDLYETHCKNNCGNIPARRREPVAYSYKLSIWWNEGLVATNEGPPNLTITSNGFIVSKPPDNLKIKLPQTWFLDRAHCFMFYIIVLYDDDTCCIFYNLGCFSIG